MRIVAELNEKYGRGYQVRMIGHRAQTEGQIVTIRECDIADVVDDEPYNLTEVIDIAKELCKMYEATTGIHENIDHCLFITLSAADKNERLDMKNFGPKEKA